MKIHERKARAALRALRRCETLYGQELITLGAQAPNVGSWFRDPSLVKLSHEVSEHEPVLFVWSSHIPEGERVRHVTVLFTVTQVLQPNSLPVRGTYGEITVSTVRIITRAELESCIRQDEAFANWICNSVDQLFWRIRQARFPSRVIFKKTIPRTSVEFLRELEPQPR